MTNPVEPDTTIKYVNFDGKVPVGSNTALRTLYTFGIVFVAIGSVIVIAAFSSLVNSYDASGPYIGLATGAGLFSVGITALLAGAIAHAINYQTMYSLTFHGNFMKN